MPISVKCSGCGKEYRLAEEFAGKKAKCKACGGVIQIPAADEDELVDFDEPPPPPVKTAPRQPPAPPVVARAAAGPVPKPPPIPKAAAALPKIAVSCDMCFFDFQAKGELAGKKAKCPECGEMVKVPAPKSKAKPTAGPAAKSKPKPKDDDDFIDDDEIIDDVFEDDDEPPPPKRGAKGNKAKKKSKGGKSSGGAEYFVDRIPMPAILGGMWTMIAVACTLLVMFGKSDRNGAAEAGAGIWGNDDDAGPPIAAAETGRAVEPYDLAAIPVPTLPELGPVQPGPGGGFVYAEAQFTGGNMPGGMMKVRMRFPHANLTPNSIGCILVGSAGTPMIYGNPIADPDYGEETQAYITAGFAVCEYSMDGELDEESEDEHAEKKAYEKFAAACAGVVNVRNAVEFILAKVPQVNPNRLYIAGHSSAGAAALLSAEHEPRLKACIAYAAPADCLQRQREMLNYMDVRGYNPDIKEFLQRSSPITHVAKLQCPVFLFHALDDSVVTPSESQQMHARLTQLGRPVTLRTVPTGDHYDSMVQQGLPMAITWLRDQKSEQPGAALEAPAAPAAAAVPMPNATP